MLHLYYTDVLRLMSTRYRNTKVAKPFSCWLLLQSSPPRGPGYASLGWHLRGCCSQQKQPPEVFCKKVVLRNFVKFTGNQLCQNLFFNRPEACNFIEKERCTGVFLWILRIFSEHILLRNTSGGCFWIKIWM